MAMNKQYVIRGNRFHKHMSRHNGFAWKQYNNCNDRHKKLAMFLYVILPYQRREQNKLDKYHKSHRSEEQQTKYEQRIIHITAKRFKLSQGQNFPLRAIILMADKGVRQAIDQYNKLYQAARANDISMHDAYEYFVLGKELPAFQSHVK